MFPRKCSQPTAENNNYPENEITKQCPNVCWNVFFFFFRQTTLGGDGHRSLQRSCCKFLRSTKFGAYLIYTMDFVSVEFFSVTHLGLCLARKCETQQTCKQTVKQLPKTTAKIHSYSSSRDSLFFLITWMKPTVRAMVRGKKKSYFIRRLGSIVCSNNQEKRHNQWWLAFCISNSALGTASYHL